MVGDELCDMGAHLLLAKRLDDQIYTRSGSRSDLLRNEGQNKKLQVDIFLMVGMRLVHKFIFDLEFETPIEITKC